MGLVQHIFMGFRVRVGSGLLISGTAMLPLVLNDRREIG